jgi:predicted XRE-type DNA-binding protein
LLEAMMEKRVLKSVWDALENSPEQATNMRPRSELVIALRAQVQAWNTTQARAAKQRSRWPQPKGPPVRASVDYENHR